jgi:death on curing protein
MIKPITVNEVEYIVFRLAKQLMDWDEPIPDIKERASGILESCLCQPFQKVYGKTLYRGLLNKAAILFYLLVKNHPLSNGNKRIAVMALILFLYINGRWLDVSNDNLYKFALNVATSLPGNKDAELLRIKEFIKKYSYRID